MECGLPNLPDEIIFNILSRLPVKPLCRFKSVSKPWLALITNPQFIKSHLDHQSTNDNMAQKLIFQSLDSPSIYSVAYEAPDHTLAELEKPWMVLNGAPHWIVGSDIDIDREVIVCFDATEEKFKEVPKPNCVGENRLIDLGVLGGCLCVFTLHAFQYYHADVWVMKEYGVKESWTKLFVVPNLPGDFNFHHFKLLCYTKDEDVLMVLNSEKVVVYNPKLNRFTSIGIPLVCNAIFYTESLVSPHGCTGTRRHH